MNISSKTHSHFGVLYGWGNNDQNYSLYDFRDLEVHSSFAKCDLVEEWFADDFNEKGYDFIEFGYSRAGDPFALWIYPELKGEPPVVLLDSDGEVELLAPSMADFLCLLTDKKSIFAEIEDDKILWYSIYNYQYNDVAEENDDFENGDQVKLAIKAEVEILQSKIEKIQPRRSVEEIIKDFDRHPNFKQWFEENVDY